MISCIVQELRQRHPGGVSCSAGAGLSTIYVSIGMMRSYQGEMEIMSVTVVIVAVEKVPRQGMTRHLLRSETSSYHLSAREKLAVNITFKLVEVVVLSTSCSNFIYLNCYIMEVVCTLT